MPWNAKADARRLGTGIPKSDFWAIDPAGIEQVGCVYTAQGFEFDYGGGIVGRDLVYRPMEIDALRLGRCLTIAMSESPRYGRMPARFAPVGQAGRAGGIRVVALDLGA